MIAAKNNEVHENHKSLSNRCKYHEAHEAPCCLRKNNKNKIDGKRMNGTKMCKSVQNTVAGHETNENGRKNCKMSRNRENLSNQQKTAKLTKKTKTEKKRTKQKACPKSCGELRGAAGSYGENPGFGHFSTFSVFRCCPRFRFLFAPSCYFCVILPEICAFILGKQILNKNEEIFSASE